jgi:nitrous oxidase accessory protein NosD
MSRCAAILVSFIAMTAPCRMASASTIHVDCDNASGIEDGSPEHPFQLISNGMDAASFGDTVLVMPGTYAENIIVDTHDPDSMNRAAVIMKDGVSLVSQAGPDSTLISAVGTEAGVYFDSCGEGTSLQGFAIETWGTGWGLRTSVLCWQSSPLITGNTILPWYQGVYCTHSSAPMIEGNTLTGGGIALVSGSGGTARANEIRGGIAVYSNGGAPLPVLIESNWIYSDRGSREDYGVNVAWGNEGDVRIISNVIEGKEVGVKLCYGELHGNRFTDNDINAEVHRYCDPRSDVDAEMNWWGTTNPAEIEAKIIDCNDDGAIPGCVDYEPWCLDEDCTQSPVLPLSWGGVKSLYRPE